MVIVVNDSKNKNAFLVKNTMYFFHKGIAKLVQFMYSIFESYFLYLSNHSITKWHRKSKCTLVMWGSEMEDPRPLPGYLGKATHPRSPFLSCRVTAA